MLPVLLCIGIGLGLFYAYFGLLIVLFAVDDDRSPVHVWAEKSVPRNVALLVFWPLMLVWIYGAAYWRRWREWRAKGKALPFGRSSL